MKNEELGNAPVSSFCLQPSAFPPAVPDCRRNKRRGCRGEWMILTAETWRRGVKTLPQISQIAQISFPNLRGSAASADSQVFLCALASWRLVPRLISCPCGENSSFPPAGKFASPTMAPSFLPAAELRTMPARWRAIRFRSASAGSRPGCACAAVHCKG